MKRKIVIVLFLLLILSTGTILLLVNKKNKPFYLEERYYETNNTRKIEIEEFNQLVDQKESFVVFVYQPMCVTSSDFENVLSQFLEDNYVSIYKIAYSNIKDTELGKKVKYYPSFLIYKEGKLIDFLEADKDEDVLYYTSKDEFTKWFTKYVQLKNNSKENTNKKEDDEALEDINLEISTQDFENIKREKGKVNIYFFWGDGCPHCEHEIEFFKSIENEYGDQYNLYMFEVWKNEENQKLLSLFAKEMNDEVTGVPYTIIGKETFKGFGESSKEKFKNAIQKESKKEFDVYFDKIVKK